MSAYATLPLVSIKILDDDDNGSTVKICKDSNALGQNLYSFEEKLKLANFP